MGREEEAIDAFRTLRIAFPEEHNAYEKLAIRMALDGNLDEAQSLADRAVILGAFCPEAWATRGYVSFARGQHADALTDLETSWNRSDEQRRRKSNHFWWLLSSLKGDHAAAEERKQKAFEEATTPFDQRILAQIQAMLKE